MKKRHGIFKRSSPERRTFRDVVYDSLLEYCRAKQLAMNETIGLTWQPHPQFILGCPENTYAADFRVRTPDTPVLYWTVANRLGGVRARSIPVPDGWIEEVKGPVRAGVGRLKRLWKAYGTLPLVILTHDGGSGLQTRWTRSVVVPSSMGRKGKL